MDALLPSPLPTSVPASFQQTSHRKPHSSRKEPESWCRVAGGTHSVPHQEETPQTGERMGRGKRLLPMYQMSTGRRSNFSFQLLLEPEIRPHTIPIKRHDCHLPARTWGQGTRTCPGHSCATRNRGKPRKNMGQCRLREAPLLTAVATGSKGTLGHHTPHQVAVHTHAMNQVVRSRCSEVSCKWLLTDLKNYPIYLHPSRRYGGR